MFPSLLSSLLYWVKRTSIRSDSLPWQTKTAALCWFKKTSTCSPTERDLAADTQCGEGEGPKTPVQFNEHSSWPSLTLHCALLYSMRSPCGFYWDVQIVVCIYNPFFTEARYSLQSRGLCREKVSLSCRTVARDTGICWTSLSGDFERYHTGEITEGRCFFFCLPLFWKHPFIL